VETLVLALCIFMAWLYSAAVSHAPRFCSTSTHVLEVQAGAARIGFALLYNLALSVQRHICMLSAPALLVQQH
jgi:hypothetical protein